MMSRSSPSVEDFMSCSPFSVPSDNSFFVRLVAGTICATSDLVGTAIELVTTSASFFFFDK
jgi:hypothetical protein